MYNKIFPCANHKYVLNWKELSSKIGNTYLHISIKFNKLCLGSCHTACKLLIYIIFQKDLKTDNL